MINNTTQKQSNHPTVTMPHYLSDEHIACLKLTDLLEKRYREVGRVITGVLDANELFSGLHRQVSCTAEGFSEVYYLPTEQNDHAIGVGEMCIEIVHSLAGTKFVGGWPNVFVPRQDARWNKMYGFYKSVNSPLHVCSLVSHAVCGILTGDTLGIIRSDTLPTNRTFGCTGYGFINKKPALITDIFYFGDYLLTIKTHMHNLGQAHVQKVCLDKHEHCQFFEPTFKN